VQLDGCVVWLRTDMGITLSGSNVTTWADQSGSGNDATSGTSPAYDVSTLINGYPTINFTAASSHFLQLPSGLTSLTSLNAFVVGKRKSANPGSSASAGFWSFGTSVNATEVPFTDGNIYDDSGSTTRKSCGAVTGLDTPFVYDVASAAGAWSNHVNGALQFSTGTNTVAVHSPPWIGKSDTGAAPQFYDGYFAEILLFNRVLSTGDQTRVRRYLGGRYAISVP
jgi:hypothetical protein